MALFLFGTFKKIVIADNLALIANAVFNDPAGRGSLGTMLGVYAFAFQIYGDFSGYTDMARGIAFMMGYDLGLNFNFPYFARGVRDFWRRWHISLSTWLRDYLYIPLGGNRCSTARRNFNIMTTMLLGGLWHGANWTFVIWGGIHGLWIVIEQTVAHASRLLRRHAAPSAESPETSAAPSSIIPKPNPFLSLLQIFATFNLICVTWLFFRAASFTDAWTMLREIFSPRQNHLPAAAPNFMVFAYIIPMLAIDLAIARTRICAWLLARPLFYWIAFWAGLAVTLAFARFGGEDFVYFQF